MDWHVQNLTPLALISWCCCRTKFQIPPCYHSPMQLIFIGDSLTEYFDWAGRFPEHHVINLGIAGEPVGWLRERVERISATYPRADRIFLQSGINDLAMGERSIESPYLDAVLKLRANYPSATLYAQSLLPTLLDWMIPPALIAQANHHISSIASSHGARYIDLHAAFLNAPQLQALLADDGIHLSNKGYELWSSIIEGTLKKSL